MTSATMTRKAERARGPFALDPDANIQITFSTGGSSAMKTLKIAEASGGISSKWRVVFTNTGFEAIECLDFAADFERHTGINIVWLERDGRQRKKFRFVGHNSASRDGGPFKELFSEPILRRDGTVGPRPLASDGPRRLCSGELKTKTAHRYLRSLGWDRYFSTIGFRADEQSRVDRRKKQDAKRAGVVEGGVGIFPLYDAGVRHDDVVAFGEQYAWWHRPVPDDTGNLIPATFFHNCDNCFMMSEMKMKMRMAARPDTVQDWIDMEGVDRGVDAVTGKVRNQYFRPKRKTMAQLFDEVKRGDFSVDLYSLKRRPGCGTCHD